MRRLFYIILAIPLLIASCGKKNDMVLGKEEMASLMADIHMAEAVVDLNYQRFPSDSTRMALKQSVYLAHEVTPEQVESSYVWYGHHIEEYMEVYDRTIEILKERQKEMLSASTERVAVAGDSVDIWPMSQHLEFSRRSPARILTFSVPADSNWQDNDVFTLNFNMVGSANPVTARMVVEYADGTSAFNLAAGVSKGQQRVSVRIDSTRTPVRILGYLLTTPKGNETVRLDSISLVRMRSELYKGYFVMRSFNYGIKPKPVNQADSLATDSIAEEPAIPQQAPESQAEGHRPMAPGHNRHQQSAPPKTAVRPSAAPPASPGKTTTAGQTGSSNGESAAQKAKRERDEMFYRNRRK